MADEIISFPIDPNEIDALNFDNEAAIIQKEIEDYFNKATVDAMEASPLISRIDQTLYLLKQADASLAKRRALKEIAAFTKDREEVLRKAESGTEAIEQAEANIAKARQALETARQTLDMEIISKQIKVALMEGYVTVNLLRAFFYDEIEYKILSIGKNSSGDDVILEAHPTYDTLFRSVAVENSTKGGIALKIMETKRQFNKMLNDLNQGDGKIKLKNTLLAQMAEVQLDENQRNVWKLFCDLTERLQNVQGAAIKYGNAAESFVTYQLDPQNITVDYIYQLLEKGRNNLAYYLGADVANFQVKALTTYGSTGRADLATLSNVTNPLTEIREIMAKGSSPAQIKETLKQFFTPQEGQGDRPFSEELGEKVREEIKAAMRNAGFDVS